MDRAALIKAKIIADILNPLCNISLPFCSDNYRAKDQPLRTPDFIYRADLVEMGIACLIDICYVVIVRRFIDHVRASNRK